MQQTNRQYNPYKQKYLLLFIGLVVLIPVFRIALKIILNTSNMGTSSNSESRKDIVNFDHEKLSSSTIKFYPKTNGIQITYREFFEKVQTNDVFTQHLISTLNSTPFPGYFFETPPCTPSTLDTPFEFVLISTSAFVGGKADDDFNSIMETKKCKENGKKSCSFPNLGGDALLVVPKRFNDSKLYNSLFEFMKSESVDLSEKLEFWREVGRSSLKRIETGGKFWFSTCGTAVFWTHFRIDTYPKYYSHSEYRNM